MISLFLDDKLRVTVLDIFETKSYLFLALEVFSYSNLKKHCITGKIKSIYLYRRGLKHINGLKGITNITDLYLGSNQLQIVNALRGITTTN